MIKLMICAIFIVAVHISAFLLDDDDTRTAVCYVRQDPKSTQNVTGVVYFRQLGADQPITIDVNLAGFAPLPDDATADQYDHGFHVHQYGDVTGGCGSTGGHYNPDGVNHGGPTDAVRHPGDFGNIKQTQDGLMITTFVDPIASLYGNKSIIGRAIVVHGGQDDLGRGGDASSLANGNAGPRLGCCVIGWAKLD